MRKLLLAVLLAACARRGGEPSLDLRMDERAFMAAAFDVLAERVDSRATLCVNITGDAEGDRPKVDAAFLARLRAKQAVVRMTDCPRTYASMIRSRTPERPPLGHIDPFIFGIRRPQSAAPGERSLTIDYRQGTQTWVHRCVITPASQPPRVVCTLVDSWIE